MGTGKGRQKRVHKILTNENEASSESSLYLVGLNKINALLNETRSPLTDKEFYKIITQKNSSILTREELLTIQYNNIRRIKVKDLTSKINNMIDNNYEYDKQLNLLGDEEQTNYRLSLSGTRQVVNLIKEIKQALA